MGDVVEPLNNAATRNRRHKSSRERDSEKTVALLGRELNKRKQEQERTTRLNRCKHNLIVINFWLSMAES